MIGCKSHSPPQRHGRFSEASRDRLRAPKIPEILCRGQAYRDTIHGLAGYLTLPYLPWQGHDRPVADDFVIRDRYIGVPAVEG
ncbi:MAG: hypothetical protein R6U98_18385 [Pirellulaceae bacterium]